MNSDDNNAGINKPIVLKFAPVWKRILSFLIDEALLLIVLTVMASFYMFGYVDELQILMQAFMKGTITATDYVNQINIIVAPNSLPMMIVFFIVHASYYSLFWSARGQTIGAMVFRIAVIDTTSQRLDIIHGLLRYLVMFLAGSVLYIPLIIVINPVFKQRLHDYISGSVVVEIPKDMPIIDEPTPPTDDDNLY